VHRLVCGLVGCLVAGQAGALVGAPAGEPGETRLGWTDVAPILERHCGECHRAGGIAPFALEGFGQARAWARSMRRAIADRTMPPWHADPGFGTFANDRRLPDTALATLLAWLDAGAPAGESTERAGAATASRDAAHAEAPSSGVPGSGVGNRPVDSWRADSWRFGEPDAVLELPLVEVPSEGEVPYHDYRIASPFAREVWLRGIEVRPGNPRVVHHVIVEAFDPRAALRPGADPRTAGSLGGYVPGDEPRLLAEGSARRLPAGAEIVLQIHYTPTGEPENDRTRVGLFLADGPPRTVVETGIVSTPFLWIPAGSVGVERRASHRFGRAVRLLSLRPHLHLRGRSFEFVARAPDGVETILLRVPSWDFDWQTTYLLAEPVELAAGTELVAIATWDNSASNPHNPDPTRDVSWGEGTSDEMMIGFFDYTVVSAPAPGAAGGDGR
jgi:hypothetical protein